MVCPKGCGLLCQAALDTILKCHDCPFYLPIGFTVANGDVVMGNAQPFTELCKATCKLSTVICLDVVWLALTGNQVIIQELSSPLSMQQGHGMGIHPLGEWIHGNKEVIISVFIPWKWTCHAGTPSDEYCATFVYPA